MSEDPEAVLRKAEEDKWQRRCSLRELALVSLAAVIILTVIAIIVVVGCPV